MHRSTPFIRALTLAALLAPAPAGIARAAAPGMPSLVPEPARMERLPGFARLDGGWRIACAPGLEGAADDARMIAAEIEGHLGVRLETGPPAPGAREIAILDLPAAFDSSALFASQGYELEIRRDRVELRAPSPAGRRYAVQTLRQIVRGNAGRALPCLSIRDWPALRWRGVSDDVSRGQMSTLLDFERIVDRLAYYKLNLYLLYIEDAYRFASHPEIGRGRNRLTADELRTLVAWGRRRGVVVAPIFETLGHQQRLLAQPGLVRFAERRTAADGPLTIFNAVPRGFALLGQLFFGAPAEATPGSTFSPVLPETRALVDSLVDELAACGSPLIHLGGDEAEDVGLGTSRARARAIGAAEVQARYLAALAKQVGERRGVQVMMYADPFRADPATVRRLPPGVTLVDWNYAPEETLTSVSALRQAGASSVIVSGGLWNWRAFYPDFGRARRNLGWTTRAAVLEGADGTVVSSWGDDGAESLRENNWPGYAYAAGAAWRGDSLAAGPFYEDYVRVEHGLGSRDLARAYASVGSLDLGTLGWNGRLFSRPVLLRPRTEPWLVRMRGLDSAMTAARRMIRSGAYAVRANYEGIELLDHAARRFRFAARREILLDSLARVTSLPATVRDPSRVADAAGALDPLIQDSETLLAEYRRLWRRHDRPVGLSLPATRMAAQTSGLRAIRDSLEAR